MLFLVQLKKGETLRVVYAQEPFPRHEGRRSIFLAGPTPRSPEVASWRPEALSILEAKSFDGLVFVPEPRDGNFGDEYDYNEQVDWEAQGLHDVSCILFWIPRDLQTLPGFTTNVEFGFWVRSGKVVLGAPENAPKMSYLRSYARRYRAPQATTLEETIEQALLLLDQMPQFSKPY